jgi:hypothetical protein
MKHPQNQWRVITLALAAVILVGTQSLAPAAPAGSLKGSATIKGNEASKIFTQGGADASGKIFGIGGGGGKGIREATTLVQGVNVEGTAIDADIAIMDNKATTITNDGARVNVQGIAVRR